MKLTSRRFWGYLRLAAFKSARYENGYTIGFEQCPSENLLDAGKVNVVLSGGDVFNGSIKALRHRLIFRQLDQELVEFKELKMQGTLIDLRNVDYLKSQDIFRNVKMADVLVVFWYKMRRNVLGCNYTLSIGTVHHHDACWIIIASKVWPTF